MSLKRKSCDSKALATRVRAHALNMTHNARASHIGSSLSVADILTVLYSRILRIDPARPDWPMRDRFILSKGHAAAALYAVLSESGFLQKNSLKTYCQDDSALGGHASMKVSGVDFSTGSLGHGLAIGSGMALAAKRDRCRYRVFVLLSDGECNEGSIWEAAMFAAHHRLDNLTAIIDYNKLQAFGRVEDVLDLEPLAEKWKSFGWSTQEIDGHNHVKIEGALSRVPLKSGKPSCIIAHTVKGKGVSFMEDQLDWHYKSPDIKQLTSALIELGVPNNDLPPWGQRR
ncbi:MAG: transketolase [Candidatus Altiarchaeota archaeon]